MRKPLILLTSVAALTACGSADDDGRDDIGAQVACEEFVTRQLASPSSAEFPGPWDFTVTGAGNEYVVSAWVDAQNMFGASLRQNFTCTVTRDDAAETWTLVDLTGIE